MPVVLAGYQLVEKRGSGAYGDVYLGYHITTGERVAVKKIRMVGDDGVPSTALREISGLRELSHPNIVELREVRHENGKLFLIFEWLDNDLKKHMDGLATGALSTRDVKSLLYQLLHGMYYCHARGIMHRDLKPQNLLVNASGVLKLADFGLARAFMMPLRAYTHEVVTLWYRAPEVLLGQRRYTPAVDIWSVGCIFAEMMNGTPLWPGDSEIDEIFHIFRSMGTPDEAAWPSVTTLPDYKPTFPRWPRRSIGKACPTLCADGVDLLERMLAYEPGARITARAALSHPYFDDLDPAALPMAYPASPAAEAGAGAGATAAAAATLGAGAGQGAVGAGAGAEAAGHVSEATGAATERVSGAGSAS